MTRAIWPNHCHTCLNLRLFSGLVWPFIIGERKSVEMAASIFSGKIQGRTGLSPPSCQSKFFGPFHWGPGEYSVAASIFVVTLMEPGHLGDGHNHPSQMSQRSQQLCKCQNQIRILAASTFCVVQDDTKTCKCTACVRYQHPTWTSGSLAGEIIFETT